jgi:RNA polymerase sigma-70 factor (ECF subfamily)
MVAVAVSGAGWVHRLFMAIDQQAATEVAPSSGSSEAYLDQLRGGNPDSWRRLFDEESAALYRYAFSRLGRTEDAEDVTNQVFEEAWRGIGRYRDEGLPLRAWLFGIARNLAGNHRRRFMTRNAQLSVDSLQVEGHPDAARAEMIDLAEAISSLDSGQAEVISLRYIHGLSLLETAAVLKTTVDGVKGRQQRALAALKTKLGR